MLVLPIRLGNAKAYAIKGERVALVDTGSPNYVQELLDAFHRLDISLKDLSLIVHTHGHSDQCGGTAALKKLCDAPAAIHEADARMLSSGVSDPLAPASLLARAVRCRFSMTHAGVAPDLLLQDGMRLDSYGIGGRIIFTPGHTAGSVSVLLDSGEAICGDLMRGGMLLRRVPHCTFFVEDRAALKAGIKHLMSFSPKILHVAQGGPLRPAGVKWRFGAA